LVPRPANSVLQDKIDLLAAKLDMENDPKIRGEILAESARLKRLLNGVVS
jgi:hypothetical protein